MFPGFFQHISLPEPANRHYVAGDLGSFLREVGGNYQRYHDFLQSELGKIGDWPDPSIGADEYLRMWGVLQDIGKAEHILRTCRAKVRGLEVPPGLTSPILRPGGVLELASVE